MKIEEGNETDILQYKIYSVIRPLFFSLLLNLDCAICESDDCLEMVLCSFACEDVFQQLFAGCFEKQQSQLPLICPQRRLDLIQQNPCCTAQHSVSSPSSNDILIIY